MKDKVMSSSREQKSECLGLDLVCTVLYSLENLTFFEIVFF